MKLLEQRYSAKQCTFLKIEYMPNISNCLFILILDSPLTYYHQQVLLQVSLPQEFFQVERKLVTVFFFHSLTQC
jgi:hypothetical protein